MVNALRYFIYDYQRYLKYSGYKSDFSDSKLRNYNLAMVYHGLEKSLSYKKRNQNSGWKNAYQILELLKEASKTTEFGYHDIASIQVLNKFINLTENLTDDRTISIKEELKNYRHFISTENHGAIEYSNQDYQKGILNDPELFFYSRYSLREFKNQIIDANSIQRAIKLALKTPSVCNRQAWAIYHTADEEIKNIVLNYQIGNKPFGNKIPNLMLIATDLKAFFSPDEHYQHWIDGGLFSMSLIYAFHALGIATCALNWSAKPKNDKALRKNLKIQDNHTIILVLAIGYPNDNNRVCASTRRPIEEIYFNLEKK